MGNRGEPLNTLEAAKNALTDAVHRKTPLLSELMDDLIHLEKLLSEKKKGAGRFIKGVSLSEQKQRVDKVSKASKELLAIATKVKKAIAAKEKRIWGDMQWMSEDDKMYADKVYEEKQAAKKARKALTDVDGG